MGYGFRDGIHNAGFLEKSNKSINFLDYLGKSNKSDSKKYIIQIDSATFFKGKSNNSIQFWSTFFLLGKSNNSIQF